MSDPNHLPISHLPTSHLPTLTEIKNALHLKDILETNPGLIIIKFGATWCGPCVKIADLVDTWFDKMPPTIQTYLINIDDNIEIYAFLKNKKMIQGIPAILAYNKGNLNYIPDDSVVGAIPNEINSFFIRCLHKVVL